MAKNKNKAKTFSEKINYANSQNEYVLELKPKCKWCWLLLLLLLPLLLLIPLKKDVSIKVVNSYNDSIVANLPVHFDYTKRDLFNFENPEFFSRHYPYKYTKYYTDTTNLNGEAFFKEIKYSVYQWLFRNNDQTRFFSESECFTLDTVINFFDLKDENIVYYHPTLRDMEFTVVDADDNNEPLPNVRVDIVADRLAYKDSVRTDNSGKVQFKNVPYCSNIFVRAEEYGWFPDSLSGQYDDINTDTLFFKQEQIIIKFFVKDKNTHKPLVNAHGHLFFESGATQIGRDAITNINGVAKGVFDNVHIIKKMKIDVNTENPQTLPFYNDSSTVDYMNFIRVDRWKALTDSQKVIFLRPKPMPLVFKDVDCNTAAGIANVKNIVLISKANGTTVPPALSISNSAGEFTVTAGIGDKITIKAQNIGTCPNEYIGDSTTIVEVLFEDLNTNAQKRIIPLCPKKATVEKFRNVDADNWNIGLQGVVNKITLDNGQSFTVTSGSDGWFEIDKVHYCQIISIFADGSPIGYGTNNDIRNKAYRDLMSPKPQNLRTIPLKQNAITVKFCDVDQNGVVISGATNEIYIDGQSQGTKSGGCFDVTAQPNSKIRIVGKFNGQTNDQKIDGSRTLQDLKNAQQSDRNIPFTVTPPPPPCNEHVNSGGDGTTINEYDMQDPNLVFRVLYDMYTERDQMIIYCGRMSNPGSIIAKTPGKVKGTGSFSIDLSQCGTSWITIKIIGGRGTSWDYKIECNN